MERNDGIGEGLYQEVLVHNKIDRCYGTRATGHELRRRQLKLSEAYPYGFLPDVTEWDDETKESLQASNPRIVMPIELASDVMRIEEVVQSVPYLPHSREGDNKHGIIVAAGVPMHTLLHTDDPDHQHDDAVRYFLRSLAHDIDDPDRLQFGSKVNGFVREKGLEKAFVYGSNAMTMLKILPQLAIPLMVARGVLNVREVSHTHVIPQLTRRYERFQDPDVIAKMMRLTKPFLEKTDDHEFQEAVVLLKAPEIIEVLQEQGISGKVLAFVDREHASGVNNWNNREAQEQNFTDAIRSMISVRKEIADIENRNLSAFDWEDFASELNKYLGTYKLYKVGNRPHARTLNALRHALPSVEFESDRIKTLINKTFIDEGVLAKPEGKYSGSGVNDF